MIRGEFTGSCVGALQEPSGRGWVTATVSRPLGLILAIAAPFAGAAQSQTPATPDSLRSSITATVRDSLGLPVVGASALITPGGFIYRTDSAGKFSARNIPPGLLTVGLRKLGFSPLQSRVSLHVGADLTLDLVMQRLPQLLAEVEIRGERQCPRFSVEGILCRRESGMGFFMNRQEILAKNVEFPMLVLRDAPGFRQNLNGDPKQVESIVGWRCFVRIVDGGFPYSYNPIQRPKDIYAVEVYQPPDIPLEYRHWSWGTRPGRKYSTPCTVVVMWTMTEAQRSLRRMESPKK
jgi:hypothetical protein